MDTQPNGKTHEAINMLKLHTRLMDPEPSSATEAAEICKELNAHFADQLQRALVPVLTEIRELRTDLRVLNAELNGKIDGVKVTTENLRHDISTVKWFVGLVVVIMLGSVALNYNLISDHSHAPVAAAPK